MTSPLYQSQTLIALPRAAYDTSLSPVVAATPGIRQAALDLQVVSFTGGTAPTITFNLDRLDANNDANSWFNIWSSGALNAATKWGIDLGPGFGTFSAPSNLVQHVVFTNQVRLTWAFGGTANPTSVTFQASLIGQTS